MLRKEGNQIVKIAKAIAVCAIAVAALSLGACAQKTQPTSSPATMGYTK